MKITTGISKEIKKQLAQKATVIMPPKLDFKINIDNKEYNATLYCYLIKEEYSQRNSMIGKIELVSKFSPITINKIVVQNLDNDKIKELEKVVFFKVDDEEYYLGEVEQCKLFNNVTFLAKNVNE